MIYTGQVVDVVVRFCNQLDPQSPILTHTVQTRIGGGNYNLMFYLQWIAKFFSLLVTTIICLLLLIYIGIIIYFSYQIMPVLLHIVITVGLYNII